MNISRSNKPNDIPVSVSFHVYDLLAKIKKRKKEKVGHNTTNSCNIPHTVETTDR